MAAIIHKVPIAHIHGGESTIGAIDETIRHSITKMSAFHFTAIDQYAKRIVQMGENPDRVFVVGAIGLDNIVSTPLMSIDELSKFSGVDFKKNVALMTYHPVTLDHYNSAEHQIQEILSTLLKTNLTVLMTMPNADTSGQIIYRFVQSFSKKYPEQFTLVKSLGQKAYLSAMQHSKLMIGNSSSGIIESASFKLPVVNIGDRQKGRVRTSNVIDCDCSQNAIRHAIDLALSDGFKTSISLLQSPYGDGKASDRIVKIIETIDFKDNRSIIEKKFFDLLFNDSDINLGKNI
jgi:UDP-hydrolysing UDP-N-acetyl-D-glucosamine 2-epimerase